MAIESLSLHNFQCHEHLDIAFDPQLTTIIGPSDVGKTAILRALKWVVINRPLGENFRRIGASHCTVVLKVDGHVIERHKGRQNIYKLNGQTLSAFGSGVPDSIANLLKMESYHFQGQHDAPYWFDLTPTALTAELNRLVELDVIDHAIDCLSSRWRRLKTEYEMTHERLESAKSQLDQLSWVPEMAKRLDQLEQMQSRFNEMRNRMIELRGLLERIDKLMACKRYEEAVWAVWLEWGQPLERRLREIRECHRTRRSLMLILDQIRNYREKFQRDKQLWDYWEQVGTTLKDKSKRILALRQDIISLKRLLTAIASAKEAFESAKQQAEQLEARWKQEGMCPVCGRPL